MTLWLNFLSVAKVNVSKYENFPKAGGCLTSHHPQQTVEANNLNLIFLVCAVFMQNWFLVISGGGQPQFPSVFLLELMLIMWAGY